MKKRTWLILLAVIILAVSGYFIFRGIQQRQKAATQYETVTLARGSLTSIVGATGTVRANQTAMIGWSTSGQIDNISVGVGEKVTAGQEMASLAETSLPQNVILASADLVTAQRNLDNLQNSNTAFAQAQLNLSNAQKSYNSAIGNQLYSNTLRYSNQDQVDAARAAVTIAQDKVNKAEDYYNRFSEVADSDPLKAAALSSLANARQNLDQAKKNLDYYLNVPTAFDVNASEAKAALAKAQLDDAQREFDRLKNGADPQDLAAARARITALQATIDMAKLTAPFAGTVTISNSLIGDQVTPGTVSFRIDDFSHYLVDVQVSEVDINKIKAGQVVNLSFDAILGKTYEGKITSAARVGTVAASGVTYSVTVELLKPDDQVLPGMTAAVNIIVSQIDNVLVVPNRAVRSVNQNLVVYVLKNNVPTAVTIKIGASSDTESQILSGDVKEGDQIVLNPPSSFLNPGTGGGRPF
ncbi:MAG: efflux RND transporter periplasmic adaptor subunit [Anaerolineaceae bacterium]|jgi:HlyD family secretion protein